ncbi:MAG: pre-peptidase C-terminal domain-containing protein [Waterburya sp.]
MIYETKMIKVCLPDWRCCIFSLTVNLLVLAILPLRVLAKPNQIIAQVPTNESNSKQAANTSNAQTALEPAILSEINRVRTNPQDYAQWLEEQREYYDGVWLRLPGEKPIRTNKGRKALEEAIAFLKDQQPLPPLQTSDQASATASSELENFATADNIQYFSYGRKTAMGIVMSLVVDDLFPDRRRRHSLLSPDVENTGVVCKSDPRYAKVCAIAYSDQAATTDVAEANPETTVQPDRETVSNTAADLAERITSPETPETLSSSETAKPEVKPKPEVATTTPTPENTKNTKNTENTENTDLATLPVPPQLEVPSTPTESREEEPPQETAADLNLKDSENIAIPQSEEDLAEVESEPEELAEADDNSQLEPEENKSETEEIAESVIEAAESESELEIEPELEAAEIAEEKTEPVADSEAEAEIAEIIEDDSEQVSTNAESDRFLEKVERGALEKGDRIIADDGSLYDFYPLEGKAGESVTIYLESDEFDAFVALVDSNGNTIQENDDINESDSNSRIQVTLPEDGTYNVIVNTYDEQGTGKYVLTVSR